MTERNNDRSKSETREDRLRAALRANLQRRKAQARARGEHAPRDEGFDVERGDRDEYRGGKPGGDDS